MRLAPLALLAAAIPLAALDAERQAMPTFLHPYEPVWFLLDSTSFNAKFQLSFSAQVVGKDQVPPPGSERPSGLYMSYSQTSLWNLESWSMPFYDTSYRPEVWGHWAGLAPGFLGSDGFDLEGGLAHESNGQPQERSRSMNKLFIRPVAIWEFGDGWDARLRPRFMSYIGDLSDNPDIEEYRGYVDLDADAGQAGGWRVGSQIRVGNSFQHASAQVDLSHPLDALTNGWGHGYAWVQLYTGYGESLYGYNENDTRLLFGIGIVR
jgi:outer membrane phospholipase A